MPSLIAAALNCSSSQVLKTPWKSLCCGKQRFRTSAWTPSSLGGRSENLVLPSKAPEDQAKWSWKHGGWELLTESSAKEKRSKWRLCELGGISRQHRWDEFCPDLDTAHRCCGPTPLPDHAGVFWNHPTLARRRASALSSANNTSPSSDQ